MIQVIALVVELLFVVFLIVVVLALVETVLSFGQDSSVSACS